MLTKEEIDKLIEIAKETKANAMNFKSSYAFGAAVLTSEGRYYGGCNIDGVISSQGTCAEMAAINHAIIHGDYVLKAVAVVGEEIIFPCGTCLQYLCQFSQVAGKEIEVVAAAENGKYEIKTLSELLPNKFFSEKLDKMLKEYASKNR